MHLLFPQTAEYALRAMTIIASQPAGTPVRAKDLVDQTHVPQPYLAKVLRKLVEAGLLRSQRGHGGGFVLARNPLEIRFVDILRAVEVDPAARHCAFGLPRCDAKNPCPLHPFWEALQERYLEWAARTTLADVDASALDRREAAERRAR